MLTKVIYIYIYILSSRVKLSGFLLFIINFLSLIASSFVTTEIYFCFVNNFSKRLDGAYAEQRALAAIEQRLFATFSPKKK